MDLEENATYYVQVTPGTIYDFSGNAYAGFSDTTTWDFTTMDERPVINYLGPTYSGVSANADLYIEFNEPVQLGNGRIVIWRSSDDSIAQTIEIANGTITGATAQIFSGSVTIDPDLDLAEQSEYYVTMTSGTFTDLNGSISYGIATTYDWRFTTGDFTAPGLVRVSPEGSDASISGNLAITFDENVQLINGYIHLYKQGKASPVLSVGIVDGAAVSGQYDVWTSGTSIVIDPYVDLEENATYYVQVTPGTIYDFSGNAYAGFSDMTTWDFTTMKSSQNNQPSSGNSTTSTLIPEDDQSKPKPTIPTFEFGNSAIIVAPYVNSGDTKTSIEVGDQITANSLIYYYDEHYQTWIAVPTKRSGNLLTGEAPKGKWIAVLDNKGIYQPGDTLLSWANPEILKLISLGVIQGDEARLFNPKDATNRYQIAVVIAKALNLDITGVDTSVMNQSEMYKDVPAWAKPYVAAVIQNNLMTGSNLGFEGTDNLSRAQMATVIGRILDLYDHKQGQAKAYRDQNDIPKWAVDGVQKSFDAGIIQGYPDGKFKPDEKVTRDQMAAIISRLMDYLIKQI
ncbi:hypothetical protein FPL14_14410 [Cohnella cholangitidis]|uniref:SLH domain-containing protein n=2 Tax=Cohnella cholangitidis TaxID=2598458 RepID=A0A7G5BZ71_9BACL|nr:hypothetical protein FPL14_14410 [Cohnella cholangitidis]